MANLCYRVSIHALRAPAFHGDINKDISKHSPAPNALHRRSQESEVAQRLPVGPGNTKNMQDHSDHAGVLRTNRSTLDDASPVRNILNFASGHWLPHSHRKMNHTDSRSSPSRSSQSGDSPKLTMSWFSSFSMLTPQFPAAMLIAQHTKSLGQLLF